MSPVRCKARWDAGKPDGDTFHVVYGEHDVQVRLLRVDTPETEKREQADGVHGRKLTDAEWAMEQANGRRATEALRGMVEGREVLLDFEKPGTEASDRFHRLLAYVYADGKCVNLEMVRGGWSRFYFYRKHDRGRLAQAFEDAERQAREGNRGLWTADGWNVSR